MMYEEFITAFEREISNQYSKHAIKYVGMEKYISYHLYTMIIEPLYMAQHADKKDFINSEFPFLIRLAKSQAKNQDIVLTPVVEDLII